MRKRWILPAAAIVIVAAFLSMVLIVHYQDSKYETYTALTYDAKDCIDVTGVFVRDERAQSVDGSAVWYLADDGEKVASGEAIARTYSDASEVTAARKASLLAEELDELESARRQSLSDAGSSVTADTFLTQIRRLTVKISAAAALGDAETAAEYRSKLTGLLNRYAGCVGTVDYTAAAEELKNEISAADAATGKYKVSYSSASGFFYSYSDGLENLSPADIMKRLDSALVAQISAQALKAGKIDSGKLVTGYRWYFVFSLPNDKAVLLSDSSLNIEFPSVSDKTIKTTVEKVVKCDDGTTAYMVSSITDISALGGRRLEAAKVVLKSSTGLRIPISALRTETLEDGTEQQGVYVAIGPRMEFRKVNVLINEGDYIVCENVDKSGWLMLYDEVIVKGKNLYDGKSM